MRKFTDFKLKKLKYKIIIYLGISLLIVFVILISYFNQNIYKNSVYYNKRRMLADANQVALEIEKRTLEAISTAKVMALAQENGLFGNRQNSINYARKVLEENSHFTGVYFGYEPNADQSDRNYLQSLPQPSKALDSTGRFLPYWFRDHQDATQIKLTPLVDMETSLYYNGVKEKYLSGAPEKYMVTEPYVYEGKLIVEQTYPIVINGQFKGIAGIDRSLADIESLLEKLNPYRTSDFILISRLGRVISETFTDQDLKTKNLQDTKYAKILDSFYKKTNTDNPLLLTDPVDGKKYFFSGAFIPSGSWTLVMRVAESEILYPIQQAVLKIILISSFSMLIMFFILGLIANSITKPIRIAVNMAKQVAAGNLNVQVKVASQDEVGELLTAIQMMTQNLSSLISQVQHSGIQVTTSTTQIAASGKQLEATVTEQLASTNEVVATSKEIAATAGELSKTMKEVAILALETTSIASISQKDLLPMETSMNDLVKATSFISTKLDIITEKANKINSIITTITKVADQTNLLSLNAAIEAEKAGEYGKGFAVLAREIRRLADQSAVATLDIETMVKEMQSAVSSGVMEMDKFAEEVRRDVEQVQQISRQLAQIIQQVQALTPRFRAVNDGMETQSFAAEQITEAMIQLSEASQQTADSLRDTNHALEQLNQAAQGLQKEVYRFQVKS